MRGDYWQHTKRTDLCSGSRKRREEGRIQKCWENIKNAKLVGASINNQIAVVAFAQCQENKNEAVEVGGGAIGWFYGL